jgi:hypothetical protein
MEELPMTGIIQQAILERIDRNGYLTLKDLPGFRQSSVVRAAMKLFRSGKIEPWTIHVDDRTEEYRGRPRTKWITIYVRPGLTDEEIARMRRENTLFRHEILKNNSQR